MTELETPVARVDLERVRANLANVVRYTSDHALKWRPHVKTHKSPRIARMQLDAGAVGLTVATPREAEVMATVCRDLLLAHPPVGSKADRLMRLPPEVELSVALDSTEALEVLGKSAERANRSVGVLVEIDVGMGRVGVQDSRGALQLARELDNHRSLRFDGVLFYPGHIRTGRDDRYPMIDESSNRLAEVLEALEEDGRPARVVSGGSTPTLWESHRFRGITEIRSGTCVFHDRDMVELGICSLDDVAYWIEATVVSTARPGQVVVDAGSKALAKETFRAGAGGFGLLPDHPGRTVRALSEEHGIIDGPGPGQGEGGWRPRVGDRIRIVPNHVCVSVNLQDRLVVVDEGPKRGDYHASERTGPGGPGAAERHDPEVIPLPARGRLPYLP